MPKVKLSKWQETRRMFKINLKRLKNKDGNTNVEMGNIIGKSGVTFGKLLNSPENMKLSELFLLCEFCNIPMSKFVSEELKW